MVYEVGTPEDCKDDWGELVGEHIVVVRIVEEERDILGVAVVGEWD